MSANLMEAISSKQLRRALETTSMWPNLMRKVLSHGLWLFGTSSDRMTIYIDGWYDNACERFTLDIGKTQYIAFDENSQGGWAAAPGYTIPIDNAGSYASTWGEFDFGSTTNAGWSGFDVSTIAAQAGNKQVLGMKVRDTISGTCSSISPNATKVENAYTFQDRKIDGIGGKLRAGPVRLAVTLGYELEEPLE